MRRWKMMFDRHGDVLRCEQLDGPPCKDGLELIVTEEREVSREGGGSVGGGGSPKGRVQPGGDSLKPQSDWNVPKEIDPAVEAREPVTA